VVGKFFWTKSIKDGHNIAMFAAGLLALPIFFPGTAFAATIERITASDNAIEVKFDDVVGKASYFTLAGPDRIALDISGVTAGAVASTSKAYNAVRQAQFDSDTTRIVFDLASPALVTGGSFSADGRSLKLKLKSSGVDEFFSFLSRSRAEILPPLMFRASPPKRQYEVTGKIGQPSKIGLPKIYGPADASLPLVVIDAGHGGHDPGSISSHGGQYEKDVTLSIAKSIRDELVASGRVRVALTRDTDKFLVLQDRFGLARKMKANLFISVHADSAASTDAHGATVYTLSEVASDREAQRLASRENKSDIINGVNLGSADANVSSILIDLTQRETMNVSADFAKVLIREAKNTMQLRSDSHKFAAFVVLKAPDTPSLLFETGYMSNTNDVAMLTSPDGQRRIGKAVAGAIQVHFARRIADK
jgi:N-acetylmuramoyl-L-alanine amidase